jgi:hypothetical protein
MPLATDARARVFQRGLPRIRHAAAVSLTVLPGQNR